MSPRDDLDPQAAEPSSQRETHEGTATGAAEAGPAPDGRERGAAPFRVADIFSGKPDSSDRTVSRVFAKRSSYAVYTAIVDSSVADGPTARDEEVFIQFADDRDEATEQLARLAALTGMRQKLDYLTRGLVKTRCYYLGQIAWALRLGLENNAQDATEVLTGSILTATEERARIGRRLYLASALFIAVLAAAVLGIFAVILGDASRGADLVAGAGAGALGALLSIAIAIRSRTVAPDHDVVANRWDAILRLTMGILSAAALVLLLTSGMVGTVSVGEHDLAGETLAGSWRAVLVVGFAAGFLERLVPDLLESRTSDRPTANELANTASPG